MENNELHDEYKVLFKNQIFPSSTLSIEYRTLRKLGYLNSVFKDCGYFIIDRLSVSSYI